MSKSKIDEKLVQEAKDQQKNKGRGKECSNDGTVILTWRIRRRWRRSRGEGQEREK